MKKEAKREIKVEIENGGPSFFSDTVTVSHNPKKFVIDFQQSTPRFSKVGNELNHQMFISHRTIIIDPEIAKDFARILSENIKRYEEKFGEINLSKKKPSGKKESYTSYIG